MIDPYVCIGTPYRPRLLIIVVYGIFLNEISSGKWAYCIRQILCAKNSRSSFFARPASWETLFSLTSAPVAHPGFKEARPTMHTRLVRAGVPHLCGQVKREGLCQLNRRNIYLLSCVGQKRAAPIHARGPVHLSLVSARLAPMRPGRASLGSYYPPNMASFIPMR